VSLGESLVYSRLKCFFPSEELNGAQAFCFGLLRIPMEHLKIVAGSSTQFLRPTELPKRYVVWEMFI